MNQFAKIVLAGLLVCLGCSASQSAFDPTPSIENARREIDAGNLAAALEIVNEALSKAPKIGSLHQLRGRILEAKKDQAGAIEAYSKALKIEPKDFHSLLDRCTILYQTQQFELALADANLAIQELTDMQDARPDNVSLLYAAHLAKANVFLATNKHEAGIAELDRAIEIEPNRTQGWIFRSDAHLAHGDGEKAHEDILQALRLAPEDPSSLYQMVKFQRDAKFGDPGLEREYLDKLMAVAPAGSTNHFGGLLWRGQQRLENREFKLGLDDLHAYLKFDEDPAVMNLIAWTLATCPDASVRDGKRAKELASKICQLTNNELPLYVDTLAAAFAELGDFEKAIQLGEQALSDEKFQSEFGKDAKSRLESYRRGKPHREP